MNMTDLQVMHLENPIGIQMDKPLFSWISKQPFDSYQIEISLTADFTKLVYTADGLSEHDRLAWEANFTPSPKTRYYWRVSGILENKIAVQSEVSFFETALMAQELRGDYITAPFSQKIHPLFYKQIQVDGKLEKARAYFTALGVYELWINGQKVSNEVLAPFYNDYRYWLQLQTYDIKDHLVEGANTICLMLGNGWYKGRFGFEHGLDELMGDHFSTIGDIDLYYADGRVEHVVTDESWLALKSPVVDSNIYDGEIFDDRLQDINFATNDADLSSANAAVKYDYDKSLITDRKSPPLIVKETIAVKEVIHTPAGETVLDFGQVLTGYVSFKHDLKEGQKISLYHGELLQHDNFYRDNLRTAKAEYHFTSSGRPGITRPYFTFYGFRFVKVEGLETLDPNDFIANVIYSDLEQTGTLETGHSKVNLLISNAFWGQKGNFLDVPTDCPQRDERMGWTGDAQVFARTASFNMDTRAFFHKYLHDMLLEQRELDGAVPHVVPDFMSAVYNKIGDTESKPNASAAWADAATIIPWTLYSQYGDKYTLAKHYENMKLWVDYMVHIDETYCEGKRLQQHGFHYADWLALDNPDNLKDPPANSPFGGTDPYYVASSYYYYSTTLLAKAAATLAKADDAVRYKKLAREIRAAVRKEYFTEDLVPKIKTQTAHVLALWFGLVDRDECSAVVEGLKELLADRDGHLSTGFVGTAYLSMTLSEFGLHEEAVSLLLKETYPGWLYSVNLGATTIWERWNSVLENGLMSDTGMNSLNHYAYGAILEWMYRYLGGLNPVEQAPGYQEAIVKPMPDQRLGHFKMSYKSAFGVYESNWHYKDDTLVYEITIPVGARARFEGKLPSTYTHNGVISHEKTPILKAGKHTIRC